MRSNAKRCLFMDWREGCTYRAIARILMVLAVVSFLGGFAA